MDKTREEFEAALEDFRACAEAVVRSHFAQNDYTFAIPNVEIFKGGRKYIKLVSTETWPNEEESQQRGVHSFVEIASGNIFKPAGWAAPAQHARGNIYEGSGDSSLTPDGGVKYLR